MGCRSSRLDAADVSPHHAASPPGSPVLTLPPSEPDEPKKRSGASASTSTLHTDSGHFHNIHSSSDSDPDPDPDDDCAHGCACDAAAAHGVRGEISRPPEELRERPMPQIPEPGASSRQQMTWEYTPYNPFPNVTSFPNYYYMKASSTPANTVYQEPYGYGNFAANVSYTGYDYGYSNPMYGIPMPPMPMPEVSPWDFFNPFDSYDYSQQHPQYRDSNGSFTSSPNSSEVREREGIPELEEETEQESMRESIKARKAVESTASARIGNVDVSAKVKTTTASMEHKECEIESVGSASILDSGEESVCSCDCDNAGCGGGAAAASASAPTGDDPGMVKKVDSEDHSSMVVAEDVLPNNFGTRDVADVVEEIKKQFNSVVACGDDVAKILEVGSMRYRPRRRIVRLVFSRLMGTFALLFSSVSEPPVNNLEQTALSASRRNQNSSQRIASTSDIELNTLSSVMDRLYVWEKRLHKEIMEEEKLRITYDKQWKRLKELDDNGAEPYKIDSTRASLRTLLTRINITIRSAKVISRRIHILRDDELHPHLVKLIQGLVRMWKFILECHRKQFHAILEAKSHVLIPKNGPERNSKVTFELEMELLNWCSCFSNWILSQKAYIETLNGWLVKWLPQEKEETPDGIAPFSPGRLGAPAVFITANDWCQNMKRIPEGTVIGAMEAFAVNVHMLRERQDEEQQQKLKADYLSRDYAKRLKSLQKEHGIAGHHEADKTVSPIADNNRAVDSRMVALDALHKRLDEQRSRHEEAVNQIQESSATDLKAGLTPIFEALESFTQETLKGYENVRIPIISRGA
uniref:DUF632 domain-containing protein n=1 Tax=Leersia perrieri TaxID=77586 RepID=A0A0D9WGQ8_9ORYZ